MDISQQFFDMCEGAYKYLGVPKKSVSESVPCSLPNLWHMPNPGTERWKGKHRVLIGDIGEVPSMKTEGAFPIYRQDQLQMFVEYPTQIRKDLKEPLPARGFVHYLSQFAEDEADKGKEYDSIDQLTMAFVMLEFRQRRWSDGKWVKA